MPGIGTPWFVTFIAAAVGFPTPPSFYLLIVATSNTMSGQALSEADRAGPLPVVVGIYHLVVVVVVVVSASFWSLTLFWRRRNSRTTPFIIPQFLNFVIRQVFQESSKSPLGQDLVP